MPFPHYGIGDTMYVGVLLFRDAVVEPFALKDLLRGWNLGLLGLRPTFPIYHQTQCQGYESVGWSDRPARPEAD